MQAAIIGRLGSNVIAANSFINVFQQLSGVAMMGLGGAAGVVIGNLIGRGKKHEEEVISFSKFLVKISVILGVIVVIMVLAIRPIAGVVIGNLIGRGKKHEEEVISFSKFLVKISVILGVIVVIMVLAIRPIAPSFINSSEQTAKLIKSMLYVSAFLLFFQAITITIFVGILRAGGDTAFCAAIDIGTLWI